MKKSKRPQRAEAVPSQRRKPLVWWPWAGALGGLLLTLAIYSPAMHGPFVLDDRALPFYTPGYERASLAEWIVGTRPMLMLSYWLNFQSSGTDPYLYHLTNLFLHFLTAVLVALIAASLLERAGVKEPALGVFAGALFLVHPLQTESVAYIASRSEVLSVLFYYGAYCVFLYRRTESITWSRSIAVLALFGAAVLSKQHTLTLPLLLLVTDLYWAKASIRANRRLYILLLVLTVGGAVFVWRGLNSSNTVGFGLKDLTPGTYFFTECRVLWTYVRLFFLPVGQNADPEVALSHNPLEHRAMLALIAWLGVMAAGWMYRKRFPLASFGVFVFLLLLAPTSSVIPIADVLQERRVYLPFVGLTLVCLELLRRLQIRQRMMIEAPVLLVLMILTYQRSAVWGDPMLLWQDTVAKSPHKLRPRFQLAFAYYERNDCVDAIANYEIAGSLAPPDYRLLVDWGKALDCARRWDEAIEKLQHATHLEFDPQAWALLGQVYGEQHRAGEAFDALIQAQRINPDFAMTYAIRGNVYESIGNFPAAAMQYQRALELNPSYEGVREALARVQR